MRFYQGVRLEWEFSKRRVEAPSGKRIAFPRASMQCMCEVCEPWDGQQRDTEGTGEESSGRGAGHTGLVFLGL